MEANLHIKYQKIIIVRRLIANSVNFECYRLKILVMKNIQKQFVIKLCTHKIILTEQGISKNLVIVIYIIEYLVIVQYVYLCTCIYFCACTYSDKCTLIFNFPFYIKSVYSLMMNCPVDNREDKLLMNPQISDCQKKV